METRTTALTVALVLVALGVAVAPVAATDSQSDDTGPALDIDVDPTHHESSVGPAGDVDLGLGGTTGPGAGDHGLVGGFLGADGVGPSLADSRVASTPSVVQPCAAEPPSDFSDPDGGTAEVVGWVDGYWYDEPLDVDVSDGVTGEELEKLSARSAARFEAMRCLTVQDGLPPVEIISREEFEDDQSQRFTAIGDTERLVDNARFETTLTVDSQTDSVEVRAADTAERVGGFYDFVANEIVVISDDPDDLRIDEEVLAHELGHAIQDQHFDLAQYERATVDQDKGKLGLIEGDVHLVEHEYLEACEAGEWSEPCLTDPGGAVPPDIANWGLYFEEIQPYSDGPAFVDDIQTTGGWDAVNDLYENPPTSSLHTVYPDTYGEVEPMDLDVPDRSSDDWDRVVLEDVPTADGVVTHDTLGISVITGMFAAPAYEEDTHGEIISEESTVNLDAAGFVDSFNPHDFAHPETEGWRGDELYTYIDDSNETATVWQLAWESAEDAQPFVDGYEQLVDIRGGERVEGYEYTYTFDNDTGYDIAVTVVPDGDTVTVVTAPTVEELTAVDQGISLVEADADDNGDGTNGDGDGTDGDGDGTNGDGDGSDEDATDAEGTGMGVELVAMTVIGTALLLALVLPTTGGAVGRDGRRQ